MTNGRAMLEAKLAKQGTELAVLKSTLQREQELSSRLRGTSPIGLVNTDRRSDSAHQEAYAALNVPVVDAKLQGRVLVSLRASLDLATSFSTQLSTLHSYLQQRCKTYPIDTGTGAQVSTVNKKLCKLLHSSSSSYTKPFISAFSQYCGRLHANPYAAPTGCSELVEFAVAHGRLAAYLDTLTPYLQLSLQEECAESVCGVQLTEVNIQISSSLPRLVATFSTTHSYLSLLARGPVEGVSVASLPVCLQRLKLSIRDLHSALEALHSLYSSKITFEYQLPGSSQKLNTTNECIVSVLSGLALTALQVAELLEEHSEVFSAALAQSTAASSQTESSTSSVVQRLRQRATSYIRALNKACPESVPYTLALHHARCMSSSSENRETLSKQVVSSQEIIVQLEQESERSKLDLQLLEVKYEKEQKKVKRLEEEVSHQSSGAVLSLTPAPSRSSLGVNPQVLSDSVGNLSVLDEEVSDEVVREELIRKHFTNRILQVKAETQEVESKAAHYYAESRAFTKQLNHNVALRVKLTQDLDTARETIQHLQDQLATTSSSYEKQLSTMSDHLCELNDRMMKQNEELEMTRRNKGKRWGGK
jgi:protein phosphatase 1 regulatory subunit 21